MRRLLTTSGFAMALSACDALIGADFDGAFERRPPGSGASAGSTSSQGGGAGRGEGGVGATPGSSGEAGAEAGASGAAGDWPVVTGGAKGEGGGSGDPDAGEPPGVAGEGGAGAAAVDAGGTSSAGRIGGSVGGGAGAPVAGGPASGSGGAIPVGGAGAGADSGSAGNLAGGGGNAAAGGLGAGSGGTAGSGEGGAPSAGAGGAGGVAGSANSGAGGAGSGAGGSAGSYECGVPTPALDPDSDLLNDSCDTDDDEDGVPDGGDSARRDPFTPKPSPTSSAPGVVLADACVKAALAGAATELEGAELGTKFPLNLEHSPNPFSTFYVSAWGVGYYVGGPDATPGALADGTEFKLLSNSASSYKHYAYAFNDTGATSAAMVSTSALRGNAETFTLFLRHGEFITIYSGSVAADGFSDVFVLVVRVGFSQYPNATCPAQLVGRWSVAWAPGWEDVTPDELVYFCRDGEEAYAPFEKWTRSSPAEACECEPGFGQPGVPATVSCTPS